MVKTNPILLLVSIPLFLATIPWNIKAHNNKTSSSSSTTHCDRTCGSTRHGRPSVMTVQYPFGFSDGCGIRLDCTPAGRATLGEFPVESVTSDGIRIVIPTECNRTLSGAVKRLFGRNYAPTSRNAILLKNCSDTGPPCEIPSIFVETNFSSLRCGATEFDKSSVSCYSESNATAFIDPVKLRRRRCRFLLSSISANSVNSSEAPISLAVEVAELGWWLDGDCRCADDANCTRVSPPGRSNRTGFRCHCKEGFVGDGFLAGFGCRKAHLDCSPARFLSGKCGGSRVVTLVGAIAVEVSITITLCLMTCCFCRRRAKQKDRQLTKRRLSEATGNLNIPIYSYKDIERATNGFSDKYRLGTGAYGTVYAGKLGSEDEWLAIKRIRHRDVDSIGQVVNEIKLISSVSHPNLVRLLGCSVDYTDQILVYEFMPNGTLSQHLQRERGDGIPWLVRLTIAMETAQAIAHLHSDIKPPIYHRDVKSSNILLDHSFRSKVADFGLSRLGIAESSHVSTAPQGTPGYLDPQYHQNFQLSDKSDVYSFGVVLVEIITGLRAVDFSRPQDEVNLASLAADRIGKGRLEEIIDPFLDPHRDAWTMSSVHKVAELAFRCLAFHRDMRPAMAEVAAELEQLRRSSSSSWPCSEDNTCTASSEACSSSSSSNVSERPLSTSFRTDRRSSELERRDILSVRDEGERALKERSVQDVWLSEHSSPASNSLLRNSTHLSN